MSGVHGHGGLMTITLTAGIAKLYEQLAPHFTSKPCIAVVVSADPATLSVLPVWTGCATHEHDTSTACVPVPDSAVNMAPATVSIQFFEFFVPVGYPSHYCC